MASPQIALTHLDEPLFDGARATKRDLVDYLEAVAGRMVSVLSGRPLSVVRVRAGQRPFMQKNVPGYAPPWIKTVSMWAESSHRQVRYALCEDKPTLIWFANQRAVEYHVTLGTAEHMDRPSYLVIDIDPPGVGEFGGGRGQAGPGSAVRGGPGGRGQDQRGQGRACLRARSGIGFSGRRGGCDPRPGRTGCAAGPRPRDDRVHQGRPRRHGVHRLDPGARRDRGGRLQPASAPRRAGLVPAGLGFTGRGVTRGLHGPERGATAGGRRSLGRCPAAAAGAASDLVAEGHTIPSPGYRPCTRASAAPAPSAARLLLPNEASPRSGRKPDAASPPGCAACS